MNLPVPFVKENVGAGDFIKRFTDALAIPPCGGCKKRQAYLNRHLTIVPMRQEQPEEKERVRWED
jgi:hypothetical protein